MNPPSSFRELLYRYGSGVISHAFGIEHAMHKQYRLNEFPDVVLLFGTPDDSGMFDARLMQQ